MTELSPHEEKILKTLKPDTWLDQRTLRTRRQTMSKLVRLGLVEEEFRTGWACHYPEHGRQYRLLEKD